jgi:hypothetical protein
MALIVELELSASCGYLDTSSNELIEPSQNATAQVRPYGLVNVRVTLANVPLAGGPIDLLHGGRYFDHDEKPYQRRRAHWQARPTRSIVLHFWTVTMGQALAAL